jgi:hypothetical protein
MSTETIIGDRIRKLAHNSRLEWSEEESLRLIALECDNLVTENKLLGRCIVDIIAIIKES